MSLTIPPLTTSTNLGPLTTPVSFPPNCLASLYDFNTYGLGLPWTYETQGCALRTCCPSGNVYTEGFAWLTSYYSPGVCPQSYTACPLPPEYTDWSTISRESIALCCPSNYGCLGPAGSPAFCQSLLATSTNVIVLNNIFDQQIISTRPFIIPASLAAEGFSSYQIAYPIQIRWKDGDFGPATGTPSTTVGSAATSPTASGSGASSGTGGSRGGSGTGTQSSSSSGITSTPAPSSSPSPLSTGSLVGIITGSVSAVAAILGVLFKVYEWKHPKKTSEV